MTYDPELIAAKLKRWEKYLSDFTLPEWEQIPDIGLYMDQVVVLLTMYLDFLPKDEKEGQVATPSAINNYVRLKIIPPPVKKRYYRVSIAYLIMVCTLKQSLGINTISKMIPCGLPADRVKSVYTDYMQTHRETSRYFIDQVHASALAILHPEDAAPGEAENAVIRLAASSAVVSGFSLLLSEKLIKLKGITLNSVSDSEIALRFEQKE